MHASKNFVFVVLGWLCIALAIVGIPLPILPTTPFVLLAAFFFAKGSEKLHKRLLAHRLFGPIIMDWESSGIIRLKAKIISTILIVPLFTYTLVFVPVALPIRLVVLASGIGVLWFIWSRPSR